MKKVGIIVGVLVVFGLAFFASEKANAEKMEDYLTGKHYIEIKIKDYGTIEAELDADVAPITVTNFMKLVENKFYDGLTFHRIIEDFMMQGGAPSEESDTSLVKNIKGEFSDNGVENDIEHIRGVISMARSDSYNSASTQFFIVHEDSPHLNGSYAAFGHVTKGMDVVDEICEEVDVEDDNGTVLEKNQPIIESIRAIEK